jgi:predicted transcriptional regulator with HTH domain
MMIDSLFGSKTRVKLLYLFMSNPGRAFYVREITRRVDEQINSVRRELANMLSVGVIKSDSVDNKLYYEVDQNYVHYKSLKGIFDNESSETAHVAVSTDWTKRLKKLSGVKIVILAGGFVSGARSKVDITIVGNPAKTQVRKFIKELEEDEHRPITYSVLSYDDFYYRLSMKDRFISEIIDGKHQVVLDMTGKLISKDGRKDGN